MQRVTLPVVSMPDPIWLEAAKAFAQIGFAAVVAWLLWERFQDHRASRKEHNKHLDNDKQVAEAMQAIAVSQQRIADSIETQIQAFRDLRIDIRDYVLEVRNIKRI